MAENGDPRVLLVTLAAEAAAAVVSGCAKTIAAARDPSRQPLLGSISARAIDYFGPKIIQRWQEGIASHSRDERVHNFTQLASFPLADCRKIVTTAMDKLASGASPEDRSVVIEYLSVIPLSVKRSLVRHPETGKMTIPTTVFGDDFQAMIRLLPPDVPPFPIGSELPGTTYILEELLGIGGFGAVYKAKNRCEQHQPPRAIKFCLDTSMLATLNRERAILDRLMEVDGSKWSDRIVRLYGYALDVKTPFLVYEYVPGGDLTSHLQLTRERTQRGYKPATALELIRQVVEALAFAHGQGMVHRDLKPANILVNGSNIKLTDFGIGGVVATHAVRGNTMLGSLAGQMSAADQANLFRGSGTPLYMSPEQRRGDQPDPRHDLYSLGVLWYQLLVGDVSRELHPGWPDELTEEHETPKEHIDLIQRCVGYFKKRPANASELLALFPGGAGIVSVPSTSSSTPPAPAAAPAAAPTAASSPALVQKEFDRLKHLLADQLEKDAFAQARETVTAILKIKPDDEDSREVRNFINERLSLPMTELQVFKNHPCWVRSVAFAPDGKRAATAGDDKTPILWDMEARKPLRYFGGHSAAVMSLAFTPDGKQLLSGSWDGSARLWNVDTGQEVQRFAGKGKQVAGVVFSPDGKRFLLASDDRVYLIDLQEKKELRQLKGHTDVVRGVVFSPEGRRAATGGDDNTVRIWDLESGKETRTISGHKESVTSVAFAPNGKWILSGSADNTARLWDAITGKELRVFDGHVNWINCVGFAPNALRIITGSGGEITDGKFKDGADTTVRIWDLQTERELFRSDKHQGSVTCVAFAPTGKLLLSGGLDKTVRLMMIPG